MGFEVEIKAHVPEQKVDSIRSFFDNREGTSFCGCTDKQDVYWAKQETDPPMFRTRLEKTDNGKEVIFTSKPLKKKDYLTEYNVENEFTADCDQWENVLEFVSGLGLKVCRRKWKKGFGWFADLDGFRIHAELLEVKFLGWFLEMEICSRHEEDIDKTAAEEALFKLLEEAGVSKSAVEPIGYNKLLVAAGHERG